MRKLDFKKCHGKKYINFTHVKLSFFFSLFSTLSFRFSNFLVLFSLFFSLLCFVFFVVFGHFVCVFLAFFSNFNVCAFPASCLEWIDFFVLHSFAFFVLSFSLSPCLFKSVSRMSIWKRRIFFWFSVTLQQLQTVFSILFFFFFLAFFYLLFLSFSLLFLEVKM